MVAGHFPWDERPRKPRRSGKSAAGERRRDTRCAICHQLVDQRDMQGGICQWCSYDAIHQDVRTS